MSDDVSREPDSNEDATTEQSESGLLERVFVNMAFERAILGAASDQERVQLAVALADNPRTDYEQVKLLFEHVGYVMHQQGRKADGEVLLVAAKAVSNAFLDRRTQQIKSGISLLYYFKGKVILTIGQAMNEGVTERLTKEMTQEMGLDTGDRDGTYAIERAAVAKLIERFGEDVVLKAYFGDLKDLEALRVAVDAQLGRHSFVRLLAVADRGAWREVFTMLSDPGTGDEC